MQEYFFWTTHHVRIFSLLLSWRPVTSPTIVAILANLVPWAFLQSQGKVPLGQGCILTAILDFTKNL